MFVLLFIISDKQLKMILKYKQNIKKQKNSAILLHKFYTLTLIFLTQNGRKNLLDVSFLTYFQANLST